MLLNLNSAPVASQPLHKVISADVLVVRERRVVRRVDINQSGLADIGADLRLVGASHRQKGPQMGFFKGARDLKRMSDHHGGMPSIRGAFKDIGAMAGRKSDFGNGCGSRQPRGGERG